jgi:hypothetical protein
VLAAALHAHRLVTQFRDLVWHVGLLVAGVAAEGQRVNWELGVLLVEDVLPVSVLPVGEDLLVVARCLDWRVLCLETLLLALGTGAVLALVHFAVRGARLNLVGVDDFGLFLQIEGLPVVLRKRRLLSVFLLVVADGHRRVRVAHKAIYTPSRLSILVVASWQLLN